MINHLGYSITKEDGLYIVEAFDLACGTLKAAKTFIQRRVDASTPRLDNYNLR